MEPGMAQALPKYVEPLPKYVEALPKLVSQPWPSLGWTLE